MAIAGYLTCFAAQGCGADGTLFDTQYTLQGSYRDPTPALSTP